MGLNFVKVLLSKNIMRSLDGLKSNLRFDDTRMPFSLDLLCGVRGDCGKGEEMNEDIFIVKEVKF